MFSWDVFKAITKFHPIILFVSASLYFNFLLYFYPPTTRSPALRWVQRLHHQCLGRPEGKSCFHPLWSWKPYQQSPSITRRHGALLGLLGQQPKGEPPQSRKLDATLVASKNPKLNYIQFKDNKQHFFFTSRKQNVYRFQPNSKHLATDCITAATLVFGGAVFHFST